MLHSPAYRKAFIPIPPLSATFYKYSRGCRLTALGGSHIGSSAIKMLNIKGRSPRGVSATGTKA